MQVRRALAAALAAGSAFAIAWLSQAPTSYAGPADALLRLSWRVPGARIEECRRLSEDELAALAPHMRRPETCVGRIADYELRVELAGEEVVRDTVHPGGVRRDRPVYVFLELPIAPGRHPVSVTFSAIVPDAFEVGDAPLEYAWAGAVAAAPDDIAMVTLDPSGTTLILRMP